MFRPHTLYIRIRIVRKVSEPAFAMKDQDVTDVIRRKQQTAMRYIGIDVSKATFVVAYSSDKGGEIRTFNNTTTGIKQFIGALPKDGSIHCVMEATGELQRLAAVYAQCRRNYCQHGESAEGKELRQSHALYDQDR